MNVNVAHCFNPKQAHEVHLVNKNMDKYRLAVILRAAGVDSDWGYSGERVNFIAKIVDRSDPTIPAIEVFANDWELEQYEIACELAAGTGLAVHLAQDCERQFESNMRPLAAARA